MSFTTAAHHCPSEMEFVDADDRRNEVTFRSASYSQPGGFHTTTLNVATGERELLLPGVRGGAGMLARHADRRRLERPRGTQPGPPLHQHPAPPGRRQGPPHGGRVPPADVADPPGRPGGAGGVSARVARARRPRRGPPGHRRLSHEQLEHEPGGQTARRAYERESTMKLINVNQRTITLELDPEDALAIAEAFRTVVYFDHAPDAATRALYETHVALFEALAVAGASYSYADLPDTFGLPTVRAALGPVALTERQA